MNKVLTSEDFIYIAVIAFFVTWMIQNIIRLKNLLNASPDAIKANEMRTIMARCYALFPLEKFNFKGREFTRGMRVKITTFQNKEFEGELIGSNSRNLICIITAKNVIAHEISNIRDITPVEN